MAAQPVEWAVPLYAKLYTGDEHYMDVARILLHGTKAMLALPVRTYDLAGQGWAGSRNIGEWAYLGVLVHIVPGCLGFLSTTYTE